ncbi:MAG: hypothetical protein QOJ37_1284, partial [Pseudonocardiales bacterium]|nr:hypothetical protein [Pseudonocardiales bacterium]
MSPQHVGRNSGVQPPTEAKRRLPRRAVAARTRARYLDEAFAQRFEPRAFSRTPGRQLLAGAVVAALAVTSFAALATSTASAATSYASGATLARDDFNRTVSAGLGSATLGGRYTVSGAPAKVNGQDAYLGPI